MVGASQIVMTGGDVSAKATLFRNHLSALSYFLLMCLVGVPVWWKTTEVYRASLPYSAIERLAEVEVVQVVHLVLVTSDSEEADMRGPALQGRLVRSSMYHTKLSARVLTEGEKVLVETAEDIKEVDERLGSRLLADSPGDLVMVELPSRLFTVTPHLVVGSHRAVYFSSYLPSEDLVAVVTDFMLGEPQMISMARSLSSPTSQSRLPPTDSARKRTTGHVDLFLSLLVPQPEYVTASWDIARATNRYLQPFLASFPLNFTVKSQVIYLTQLNIPAARTGSGPLELSPDQLGLAVNSVESVLASQSSDNPGLNLLVYVPPVDRAPLTVSGSESNSFLIPRWGGVHIYNYNLDTDNVKLPLRLTLDMGAVCGVWLGQLRALLGVQEVPGQYQVTPVLSEGLRWWERDFQLRYRSLENLLDSVSTLSSLSSLLSQIPNIVIREEVGQLVDQAVDRADTSSRLSSLPGRLEDSYQASVEGLQLAETVFFDQSLLALLYFPDDQKYAIYIPFFLPVAIPVLLSLKSLVKFFKGEVKSKSE